MSNGGTARVSRFGNEADDAGDVFFRPDGIYFCVAGDPEGRPDPFEDPAEGVGERRLAVGLITEDGGNAAERLQAFADEFAKSVTGTLDGRRTRHMKFNWAPPAPVDRLAVLRAHLEEGGGTPTFAEPDMSAEMRAGAEVLADRAARELLRELAEAGFARESDILARRGRKEDEVRALLAILKDAGLVLSEYLLQCKRSSAQITKLADPAKLEDSSVGDLECAGCGRRFADELLSEGYSVSPLGRSLSKSSHWMTVWVTARLEESGVPLTAIMWNLEEAGEEVDILVDFLSRLWILELKDREFGPGDAHPFNYRRVRYRAEEALVISTEKVSAAAKRVFQELSVGSEVNPRRRSPEPTLIENLGTVKSTFDARFNRASFLLAARQLRPITLSTGYDLGQILRVKHGPKV
jgi:hypothetical protein